MKSRMRIEKCYYTVIKIISTRDIYLLYSCNIKLYFYTISKKIDTFESLRISASFK